MAARSAHASVVLNDGSVLVMGGTLCNSLDEIGGSYIWKTTDGGASWNLITDRGGWTGKQLTLSTSPHTWA